MHSQNFGIILVAYPHCPRARLLLLFSPPQLWRFLKSAWSSFKNLWLKYLSVLWLFWFFEDFSSKLHPTAATFPFRPYPPAITPTSLSPPHNPQAFVPLPSLWIFYFIYPHSLPQSFSEFICSPLCSCQSSLSSGFAFIKCIPHPLAFYSTSSTRQILSLTSTNDSSARSASLIIYLTYIYLFLQQVPESRGFSSVPCHLKQCHYQPLLQLGGKLASRGWGLNSSWQGKQH